MQANLRLNLTGGESDPLSRSVRYQTAIQMAKFADEKGFTSVNLEEHHVAENGWLPSPLVMAGAIASITERINIGIMALLAPLYDPIRLAEDIAVIDLISQGRFSFIAGQGYREIEYHISNKPYEKRGEWMDHVLDTLLKSWDDEAFEYRGKMVNVTPKPFSRPHPPFLIGGMSRPAARRAARFGLPFSPPVSNPELETYYHEQLAQYGKEGYVSCPPANVSVLFLDEDPESAWKDIGSYFLNEATEYGRWGTEDLERPLEIDHSNLDVLRDTGFYEIITPEECLNRHLGNDSFYAVVHPLVGGMPIDRSWHCMELYASQVLSKLVKG